MTNPLFMPLWINRKLALLFFALSAMHLAAACLPSKARSVCNALNYKDGKWLLESVNKELSQINPNQEDELVLQAVDERLSKLPCVESVETGEDIVQTLPPTVIIKVVFKQDTARLEKHLDLVWTKKEIVVRNMH